MAISANQKSADMAEMADMEMYAEEAANLLKMMANKHRLLVLCTLIGGELSVGQLNQLTPLSQSSLSQHLASLREAGLVKTRRESQSIYYSLAGDDVIKIISVLHSIFCSEL